ncbi:MAG: Ada metal-binding domain-containing protein [Candidatus Thorarchaeota archaeon]
MMKKVNGLAFEDMFRIAKACDGTYDGKFWVAVKTTKIYCLPSCKAKSPLPKNVTFYATREEAIANNYRGCKRCKSEFFPNVEPKWLKRVLAFMRTNQTRKITERELEKLTGTEITTIRRYFKSRHKISPMAYHRKVRLSYARILLQQGNSVQEVSNQVGFSSVNGFIYAFSKEYGVSPRGI